MTTKSRTAIIKLFRSKDEQVLIIPSAVALNTDTVSIERRGDSLIVRPTSLSVGWSSFFADERLVLPGNFSPGDDPIVYDNPTHETKDPTAPKSPPYDPA